MSIQTVGFAAFALNITLNDLNIGYYADNWVDWMKKAAEIIISRLKMWMNFALNSRHS